MCIIVYFGFTLCGSCVYDCLLWVYIMWVLGQICWRVLFPACRRSGVGFWLPCCCLCVCRGGVSGRAGWLFHTGRLRNDHRHGQEERPQHVHQSKTHPSSSIDLQYLPQGHTHLLVPLYCSDYCFADVTLQSTLSRFLLQQTHLQVLHFFSTASLFLWHPSP